jgi:hypothetical protein
VRKKTIAYSLNDNFEYNKMKKLFAIYLISFAQIFSSCNRTEPETYLIPSGFLGEVNILFNQNGIPVKYKDEHNRDTVYTPQIGKPVKYEDGRRVYEIPDNGILLTQFKDEYGFVDRKYFSIDSNGKRTRLEVFEFVHFKKDSAGYVVNDKNKIGVFGDGTSVSYGNMNIAAQDFTVSSYNMLDSLNSKENIDRFNNKVEKILGLPH